MATVHPNRPGTRCMSVIGETESEMREPPAAFRSGALEQGETDTET